MSRIAKDRDDRLNHIATASSPNATAAARATAPSRLSLADAQQRYDEVIDRYPV
jgi:hypothetical protein